MSACNSMLTWHYALLQLPSLVPQLANFLQKNAHFTRNHLAKVVDLLGQEHGPTDVQLSSCHRHIVYALRLGRRGWPSGHVKLLAQRM